MSRKVFDRLAGFLGLGLTVVLVVAGGLMMWGHSYATSNVHNQLAAQQIYFPSTAEVAAVRHQYATTGKTTDPEFPNRAMVAHIAPYAGQQVLTGDQAATYADWFIGQHLAAMPYGGVYSKVSAAARAATPGSAQATKLSALEGTVFQGTTLRGLLLEAYAFGTIGVVMLWGAIASFIMAALMAALTVLGFRHAAHVSADEQFGGRAPATRLAAGAI
jgi:hypothetical protein